MAGGLEVSRRVLALRIVAATDVATAQAHPEVDPAPTRGQALLAADRPRLGIRAFVKVLAVGASSAEPGREIAKRVGDTGHMDDASVRPQEDAW